MLRGIKISIGTALTGVSLILFSLFNLASVSASGGRISTSGDNYTINEGSSLVVTLILNAPIICPLSAPTCNVSLTFSSSDPARETVTPSTIDWNYNVWSQTRTITINTVNENTYSPNESILLSANAVTNSVYYSNFLVTINSTVVSINPAPSPAITSMSASVNNNSSITQDVLSGVSGSPDPSTLAITTPPTHGVAVDPPGTITYTPNPGYVGTDSLVYKVCSSIDSSVCSSATLSFNVLAPYVSTTTQNTSKSTLVPDTGYGQPRAGDQFPSILSGLAAIGLVLGLYFYYKENNSISREPVKKL